MSASAVETFWRAAVSSRRAKREALLTSLAAGAAADVDRSQERAASAAKGELGAMTNEELLSLVDDAKGVGDAAVSAKHLLIDRYTRASLLSLSEADLAAIVADEREDPMRRKVAERMIGEGGVGRGGEL